VREGDKIILQLKVYLDYKREKTAKCTPAINCKQQHKVPVAATRVNCRKANTGNYLQAAIIYYRVYLY